jgi:cyclase
MATPQAPLSERRPIGEYAGSRPEGAVMEPLGSTMRVVRPAPHVLAFYDGRIEGRRAWSHEPNWLDDGAYTLGIASYAVVDGGEALVYDTHMSIPHAEVVRHTLEEAGVRSIRVVLSHWHDDHVAGNAAFADCEILARRATAELLAANRGKLEAGNPPIRPLVMPSRLFEGPLALAVGGIAVEIHPFDIHSRDAAVLLLPESGLMLAGDTLEDSVTYVAEPDRLEAHLADLDRMKGLRFRAVLPNHGDPEVIAAGGYGPSLIDATKAYVERLLACRDDPVLAALDLETFAAPEFEAGSLRYYAAYEPVHRQNVAAVTGAR